MDHSYVSIGFEFENNGKYFTFMVDAAFMNLITETTARRNYYIGVGDEVEYNGAEYTNMKIPAGTPFSMDITGCRSDLRCLFTPFALKPAETVRFSPWLNLSVMLFKGSVSY